MPASAAPHSTPVPTAALDGVLMATASDGGPAHARPDAPRPVVPRTGARPMFALHRLLERNRLWYRLALWLESSPRLYQAWTRAEEWVKGKLFGCRMCAQCALPSTAYACPMTCPKQLRNGPCGGASLQGTCEVYPDLRCVWVVAYERAERDHRVGDLRRLQRPIDHRGWGESSWVNHWLGRDEGLWTPDDGLDEPPAIDEGWAPSSELQVGGPSARSSAPGSQDHGGGTP